VTDGVPGSPRPEAGLDDVVLDVKVSVPQLRPGLVSRAVLIDTVRRNSAVAIGSTQSQRCHTNRCPVGVTTQDAKLQRALIVPDKAERVHNYHRNTVHALAEMIAAMGLDHTSELSPHHVVRRVSQFQSLALDEIYDLVQPGALLGGAAPPRFQGFWDEASAESFRPWSVAEHAPAG
jgi:hypothetical protein